MQYRPQRRPTDLRAVLIAESGEYAVTLRNVAPEGIKLSGVGGYVHPDAEVTLELMDRSLPGHVSWVDGDVIGVRLTAPLSKDLAASIARTVSTGGRLPKPRW